MAGVETKPEMDAIYEMLWSAQDQPPFTGLDQSLDPRPTSETMLQVVARLGVSPNQTVLDVGSGRGNHTCTLAQKFGCSVIGLDPVMRNIRMGCAMAKEQDLAAKVAFQRGVVEALPFADEVFDLIWCRDVLVHVLGVRQSMSECARVLKSGGAVVLYTTFATDLMEPNKAARIFGPLGIVLGSTSSSAVEDAFIAAGLVIQSREVIGSVVMELMEEGEGRASQYLLRIARMMRAKERFLVELGEERYQTGCALYHWGVYLLLGKLSASLYTLKKGAG